MKKEQKKSKEKLLAEKVQKEYYDRLNKRKMFETQWKLNMNYYMGNQYCDINGVGEIVEFGNRFYWQEHQIFNHIASIVERRISKLSRVRPKMSVFPATNDEKDLKTAAISKKIINSVYSSEDMEKVICEVTRWSEICGTGFYKVCWNAKNGQCVGIIDDTKIMDGDVEISAVSPFEIFPENTFEPSIEKQPSLIFARAFHIADIKKYYGIDVKPENINLLTLSKNCAEFGGRSQITRMGTSDYALVIEYYERPSVEYPQGRMIVVAGGELICDNELPYMNDENKERIFPFVKQDSISEVGSFWGVSVIERLIPLQRSYNAIKNRKHEFINRLSMGVLTVEDGSLDMEGLEDEGLCPGKVLVYRQGANKPQYMDNEKIPYDFLSEEKSILDEFAKISGVSDLNTETYVRQGLSGTALALMVEQDESKLLVSNDNIKYAIKTVAKHIIRLYKQFVKMPKLLKLVGDNGKMEAFYFSASDIGSDDVMFETKNENIDSFAQRRELIFQLIDKGILNDENDKMSNHMKSKILEILGYGIWENANDIKEKHKAKASNENYKFFKNEDVTLLEIDDHDVHVKEHISFMLSNEFDKACKVNKTLEDKILNHIRRHKEILKNINK